MKKFGYVLALMLLLVPAFAYAAPPGCTWEGDPAFRYGWNYLDGLPYYQPGPDTATIVAGGSIARELGPYNASTVWTPTICKALDTLCFDAYDNLGWGLTGVFGAHNTPFGDLYILGSAYLWYQWIQITAPCSAALGATDMVVAGCYYANNAGVCDRTCGDCVDPDTRPADGLKYYNRDTLYVIVVAPPPSLSIVQADTVAVERGQTQAYVGFSLCNTNPCAPPTEIFYSIRSFGTVPRVSYPWAGSVTVPGGECRYAYAILNASAAVKCTWDTLWIKAWTAGAAAGDTVRCTQKVHIIEPRVVPLFTVPVVTILVLALILAAAVFMRRRAVNRA